MNLTLNVDRRVLAIGGAVLTASAVAAAASLAAIFGTGHLQLNQADMAHVLAAALGGAVSAYTQTSRTDTTTPAAVAKPA